MAFSLLPMALVAQSTFYNTAQIQRIAIQFSQANWDYRMDTAKVGAETYLMADWVEINGLRYDSVGVKYKGNSSFDSTRVKNPLNISLDEYLNQSHEGYTTVKLGNGYADPSLVREVLAYGILQNYMHCPQANFAQVYINGNYIGVYSNVENINKEFCSNHFYSSSGTFFKCNPISIPSPVTKSNLQTLTGDSTAYFPRYELKSAAGWNDLVDLCDVVTTNAQTLSANMDMDRAIWMLAFNDVLVNLDSYSGVFTQNYYLYRDQTGHFNPVIWDLNMSFGGFPFLGVGTSGTASLTVPNMEQLPIDIHATDPNWPLIKSVMATPRYKRMYLAHLRAITDEMIASGSYATQAATFQAQIDTAVASDSHKFYTYTQFQNALTTGAPNGSFTVPGISSLMTARLAYLQGTPQFGYAQPSISSVLPSPAAPALNSTVTVTAQVSGADSAFLGYRLDQSLKFTRVPMYDDGAHGDAGAGDGLYGASFSLTAAEAQYYVYAENADIGAFSPARAEHEFHTVQAALSLPQPGDLVINEFLAVNATGQTDEAGQLEDWIELYNTTNGNLALTGLYLSDNLLNRSKYAFPAGTVMPAHSFLIVWADEDSSTVSYLHSNFKLSSQGEEILLSDGGSLMLDSIVYGPQVADISQGRCPDGSGALGPRTTPTFGAYNCTVATQDPQAGQVLLTVFPNPADQAVQIWASAPFKGELIVTNAMGTKIHAEKWVGNATLDVKELLTGVYFIQLGSSTKKLVVIH
jgi:CotH kinase protein/Lamin Tail Domain/Secretion system C-terminal sorting domain